MNEEKKKIYLFMFVVMVLNGFYCMVMNQYTLLIWLIISLAVAYFSIYPDEFFLCVNNAKAIIRNYKRNDKTSLSSLSNIERERPAEEEDIKRDFERAGNPHSFKIP